MPWKYRSEQGQTQLPFQLSSERIIFGGGYENHPEFGTRGTREEVELETLSEWV